MLSDTVGRCKSDDILTRKILEKNVAATADQSIIHSFERTRVGFCWLSTGCRAKRGGKEREILLQTPNEGVSSGKRWQTLLLAVDRWLHRSTAQEESDERQAEEDSYQLLPPSILSLLTN